MPRRKALATVLFASALALDTMGCGVSSSIRVLQSITVSPATADAKDFPNGQVQFTATGTFSKPPSPSPITFADPYSGQWFVDPAIATLVETGMGTATFQCVAAALGTTTVRATASAGPDQGQKAMSIAVNGTATLTCP